MIRSEVSSENSSSVSELRLLLSVKADFFPIITSPGNHKWFQVLKVKRVNMELEVNHAKVHDAIYTRLIPLVDFRQPWQMWDFFNVVLCRF